MTGGRGVRQFARTTIAILALFGVTTSAYAADVTQLQQSLDAKKAAISTLNSQLDTYRQKIKALAGKSASLQNDIALLENEIAMSQLDVAATQNAIDQENLELRIVDNNIAETESQLATRKAMLATMLFSVNSSDDRSVIDMVMNIGSVNDVFDAAQQLARVNEDVKSAVDATQKTREDLAARQAQHEASVQRLAQEESDLQKKIDDLTLRKNAKDVLAQATANSENQYRTLMSELRAEQQSLASDVANLQNEMQSKLAQHDGASAGDSAITWPVHGIITTLFHDPTYPFRNLFEHSGLDIAVPQGTAIEAAAPGYVARVYKGQQYGYYVLIVHANGLATLYAHMSRIDVVQDQYVSRGEVIGLSGGRPGSDGAGFSTGPHVHFEVRLNGIPTNPLAYLDMNAL